MPELKIYISNSLNEKFRKIAMSIYGYGRGSLSRAAEDAFANWCAAHDRGPSLLEKPGQREKASDLPEAGQSRIDPEERPNSGSKSDKASENVPEPAKLEHIY